MGRRARLDTELVRRGLARSREHAAELVAAGRVMVAGRPVAKAATQVDAAEPVVVATDEAQWVSRGAHKLLGALEVFDDLDVAGRRCLDAGASTGGFTEVLLKRGAAEVVAVDVGYGQLAWSLRTAPRVVVLDRTNVRDLQPEQVGEPLPSLTVADLSFIGLGLVLPALRRCTQPDGELLVMVKPQFEVGRDRLGAGGVVREPELRVQAVVQVASAAELSGLGVLGVAASPLPGPAGNVEYFLWLRAGAPAVDPVQVALVVAEGPQ
jgi:23S rRNA (cytidine1920-2'-O)/16S rRNA (cytidine1409-2'-O)-methyltransferase